MKVSVKFVMFRQKTLHEEGEYCGYCPALRAFHVMTSFEEIHSYMQKRFEEELEGRLHYNTLRIIGWQVSENSAKPPIFADKEIVKLTEELFEVKIQKPIIVEIYAELPPAKDRYANIPDTHKDIGGFFGQ